MTPPLFFFVFCAPSAATYTEGSVINVNVRIRVHHGGWLGVKICPSTRLNPTQACFDSYPLTK